MFKKLSLLISLILISATIYAVDTALGFSLNYFNAGFEGLDVKLEWEISNEAGISRFEIHRKGANESNYKRLASLNTNGSRKYSHLDTDLSQNSNVSGQLTYKLTVVTSSGEQNFLTTISQSPTAVQRSWGSIKSMFR